MCLRATQGGAKVGALSKLGTGCCKVEHAKPKAERPISEQVDDFLTERGIGPESSKVSEASRKLKASPRFEPEL